jgi:UDP-glucose-4-epimerase GalE
MTRVAVTGGAGYIGSHMCKQLAERGHDVVVIDDLSGGHREAVRWGRLLQCSLLDPTALSRALRDARCDSVIHFAGASAIGESVADPLKYHAINVGGSLNLLQAMRDAGVRRIVFSSSAAIFGEPQQALIDESHPVDPISPYGRGKAMVERLLRDAAAAYGIDAAALRYFNAAGADPAATIGESHDPETHLVPRLLRHAAGEPGPIEIYGDDHATPDGTCIRDYVHVDDLCTAHLAALGYLDTHAGFHAFNLGNGTGCSVREVIAAVRAVTGRPVDVRVAARRAGDPARLVACSERARAVLGWRPATPTLEAIVETAWRWHRAPAY